MARLKWSRPSPWWGARSSTELLAGWAGRIQSFASELETRTSSGGTHSSGQQARSRAASVRATRARALAAWTTGTSWCTALQEAPHTTMRRLQTVDFPALPTKLFCRYPDKAHSAWYSGKLATLSHAALLRAARHPSAPHRHTHTQAPSQADRQTDARALTDRPGKRTSAS